MIEERTCPVCGFDFEPDEENRVYCCSSCRKTAAKKLRDSILRNNTPTPARDDRGATLYQFRQFLPPQKCVICGSEFVPVNRFQKTCKNPDCKRELKRQNDKRQWLKHGGYNLPESSICVICGKTYKPRRSGQETCCKSCSGKLARKRIREKKHE